jgi:hypothetical protein
MNRAMGFGVVAGGVLTGLVTVPSPASAHDHGLATAEGIVQVTRGHRELFVANYGPDGIDVGANWKLSDGTPHAFTPTDGGPPGRFVYSGSTTIVAFRKCQQNLFTGEFGCSGWQAA